MSRRPLPVPPSRAVPGRGVRAGLALSALTALVLLAGAGLPACGGRIERTFDADRAFAHLVAQVEAGSRVPGSPAHARTLESLRAHFEARADRVVEHRATAFSALESTDLELVNLVAVFGPERPVRILLGAHWDSRARADQEEDPALRRLPVPGANDGASGVAILQEVATALAAVPPTVGVDLVLFDGEDQGVDEDPETWALGSAAFVRDHPDYRPAFAVIIDMVGRRGTRLPKEGHSVLAAARLVEAVWQTGRALGLDVLADSLGAPVMDDHIPFLRAGIPAIDLIGFDDPDWHTTRDLPPNCDPAVLDQVGRLLLGVVARAESTLAR